jgi:hypothetical protein
MEDNHMHDILIKSLVSLCDRATIDIGGGIDRAICTIICISLKYLDRKLLLEQVVPGGYVDWDYIENSQPLLSSKHNLLGDSDIWLQLLPYLDFGDLAMEAPELQSTHSPIWTVYQTIEEHTGHQKTIEEHTGNQPIEEHMGHQKLWKFDDTCKLFLLSNLKSIPFKYAAERYTDLHGRETSHTMCAKIMETMAEERHEAGVYLASMQYLLSKCIIDTSAIQQHIAHFVHTKELRQACWTMKHVRIQCRPSMRSILANKRIVEGSVSSRDAIHDDASGVVTFAAFCDNIRFPNCMSHLLRSRCYLLACQCPIHIDFTEYTRRLVSEDIANCIDCNGIAYPDEVSLQQSISTLTLNTQPFDELLLFRKNCFTSYASIQSDKLTMTDVLKLYVAAYQYAPIWKQLWKNVNPLMSTQISKDVEQFVRQNKFAAVNFVEILRTSTPFSLQT